MHAVAELQRHQPLAINSLMGAVRNGRLHHGYILAGSQTEVASAIADATAAAIMCTAAYGSQRNSDGACGDCPGCRKYAGGNHPDVIRVNPNDKGTIKVDAIRELTARLSLRAAEADTKVVCIHPADAMNPAAQNALLKTLEEPPGPTCFFLVARRYRALLPTVRSRCQRVHLVASSTQNHAEALSAAGITSEFISLIAALVGSNVERAQHLLDDGGAEEILRTLHGTLKQSATIADLLNAAADLGSDRERAELALSFLEVALRDALAAAQGTDPEKLHDPAAASTLATLPRTALVGAVDRIMVLRKHSTFNLNRSLAFESLFLTLRSDLVDARSQGAA